MNDIVKVHDDAEIIEHEPAKPLAQASISQSLASMMTAGPELAKALAKAITGCPAVEKGSKNTFHKYDYASSDDIIEVGRKALADNGLVLLPIESSLNGSERDGADRFELVRTFILLHESGQKVPLRVAWPVVPDKGRPLDKATAAADTLSLAYLLRDLLQMPRVAPGEDIQARDDRHYQPQQRSPQQAPPRQPQQQSQQQQRPTPPSQAKPAPTGGNGAPKTSPGMPANGEELKKRLQDYDRRLVEQGIILSGELMKHVSQAGVKQKALVADIGKWNGPAIKFAYEEVSRFEKQRRDAKTAMPPAREPGDEGPDEEIPY